MASDTIFLVNNTIQVGRENEVADLGNKDFYDLSLIRAQRFYFSTWSLIASIRNMNLNLRMCDFSTQCWSSR